MKLADRRHDAGRDFSAILMWSAVAGAVAHVLGTIVEFGRAARWWP